MLNRRALYRGFSSAVVVLSAVILGACEQMEAPLPRPRRVVLITVDTLRADHLGVYGYPRATSPNLDRLAERGVRFERAIAQWPKTTPSFASMFTGRYPQSTGMTHRAARRLPEAYVTLAEMLQGVGFSTAAVVSNPVLSTELGWDQGFDEYIETWKTDHDLGSDPLEFRRVINAPQVNELARPLLASLSQRERVFVWLHYSDPHAPYLLPEGFPNPFLRDPFDVGDEQVPGVIDAGARIEDQRRLGFYVAQYDANIQVVDRFIGEILDDMEELGLLEDALVVFTSDHGEGMGEHDYYFRHGGIPYNTNSHVPLLISFRGAIGGGRVADLPVELIDLYPTLAEMVATAEAAAGLEGRSLVPFLSDAGTGERVDPAPFRYALSEAGQPKSLRSYYRTIQDRQWKLVFHPAVEKRGRQAPTLFELYDLRADPLEQSNLAGQHPEEFDRLWTELSDWMLQGDPESADMGEEEGHSEATLEALRALGYLN